MRISKLLRGACIAAHLVLFFTLGTAMALADTMTLTLGVSNAALVPYPGPYATVTVDRTDSTHASITFASLINGGFVYLMGSNASADLNINGSYSLGAINETNSISGFTPTLKANTPGVVGGFGSFNLSLNNFGGFTDSADDIQFTLTKSSGAWSSALNVLAANGNGYEAATHMFACSTPCSTTTGAVMTGYAANAIVPEPASIALLGAVVLLLWPLRKRFV